MDDNQDAIELKRRARRRLVGAIALVVFVVIVLPIIFDHEPKSLTQDLSIQIPSQDGGKGVVKPTASPVVEQVVPSTEPAATPIPVPQPAPAIATMPAPTALEAAPREPVKPAKIAEPADAPKSEGTKSELPKPEKKVAELKTVPKPAKDSAKATSAPVAKDEAPVAPAQAGFYVPLGVFSKSENVRQVQSKVSAAGFKSYAEKGAGSTQTKVRAGPFATREAAENARDKLKSAGMDVGPVGSR